MLQSIFACGTNLAMDTFNTPPPSTCFFFTGVAPAPEDTEQARDTIQQINKDIKHRTFSGGWALLFEACKERCRAPSASFHLSSQPPSVSHDKSHRLLLPLSRCCDASLSRWRCRDIRSPRLGLPRRPRLETALYTSTRGRVQSAFPLILGGDAYVRQIYTMALNKNHGAARLLGQLRSQFPGDLRRVIPLPF